MKFLYDRRYPVTSILLLVTTAVFLSMFIRFGGDYQTGAAIYYSGGVIGEVIQMDPSQLWRLITAIFVHIGLEHFAVNMISLYYLGHLGEDLFGSKAFLALYLLSGIMGNVFVAIFTPDAIAAGASTALFGLFGTIGALRFIVQSPYIRHLSQSYTSLIVVNLIFSFGRAYRWLSSWGDAGLCLSSKRGGPLYEPNLSDQCRLVLSLTITLFFRQIGESFLKVLL